MFGDNQTTQSALEAAIAGKTGSGIFAVANPRSSEPMAVQKVIVPNIDYRDCVQRGAFCLAFKWVPGVFAEESPCTSAGAPCVRDCSEDLCLCVGGRCQ